MKSLFQHKTTSTINSGVEASAPAWSRMPKDEGRVRQHEFTTQEWSLPHAGSSPLQAMDQEKTWEKCL